LLVSVLKGEDTERERERDEENKYGKDDNDVL
jgi:hypothetical protein